MKKNLVFLILIFTLFSQSIVLGQTIDATPSSKAVTPTVNTEEDREIKNLKDKIATKVAELREKNNKAISGMVESINGNSVKIKNENDEEYEVKLDDALTKYYQINGASKKEIKAEDLKAKMFLIITGVLNDKIINANTIYVDELFLVKSGKITEVDKVKFSLKVLSSDKDTYDIGIESTTKQQIINVKTLEVERTGFSKIKEGDTIHFVVKKSGEEKDNSYTANKILIIPQEYFMQ